MEFTTPDGETKRRRRIVMRSDAVEAEVEVPFEVVTPPEAREDMVVASRSGRRTRATLLTDRGLKAIEIYDGSEWSWWWDGLGAWRSPRRPYAEGTTVTELMFEPARLVDFLEVADVGRPSERAGRPVVVLDCRPLALPVVAEGEILGRAIEPFGVGADHYALELDAEHGVVLGVTATRDGEPFRVIEALEVEFEPQLPEDEFTLTPPDGSEIRPAPERAENRSVSIDEACELVPFHVLTPASVPSDWRFYCRYFAAVERDPEPFGPYLLMSYRSPDTEERIALIECAVGLPIRPLEIFTWRPVERDGQIIHVAEADVGRSHVYTEIDGTLAVIRSPNLDDEKLIEVATSLRQLSPR